MKQMLAGKMGSEEGLPNIQNPMRWAKDSPPAVMAHQTSLQSARCEGIWIAYAKSMACIARTHSAPFLRDNNAGVGVGARCGYKRAPAGNMKATKHQAATHMHTKAALRLGLGRGRRDRVDEGDSG